MNRIRQFHLSTAAAIGFAALLAIPHGARAQGAAQGAAQVAIDNDDIGGVVRGPNGPEAGVWVIAETLDLPTRFTRSVVTDDQGRYVLPDLPKAKYKVWVRGYGLVDSAKVDGEPGQQLNLTAVPAPSEAAAAQYYPAIYWYSMMKIPPARPVRRQERHSGQRDSERMARHAQEQRLHRLPPARPGSDPHDPGGIRRHSRSGEEAWMRRTQSGQAGEMMVNILAGQLGGVPYKYFGDWTDRVAKGELPHAKPPRPAGVERNIVVTTWDWGDEKTLSSRPDRVRPARSDRQRLRPASTARPNIPPTGCRSSTRRPTRCRSSRRRCAIRTCRCRSAPATPPETRLLEPSAYWGDEKIWDTRVNNHNSMFDGKGRLWLAAAIRGVENPAFCRRGSDHPFGQAAPAGAEPAAGRDVSTRRPGNTPSSTPASAPST